MLIADRFLSSEREVIDLATGETVRLAIEPRPSRVLVARRLASCDRLAGLRHPLLRPLVDYGTFGSCWFEAQACLAALRVSGVQARQTALHLVRFLRAADADLTGEEAGRNVRPAIDGPVAGWRPIGVFLQSRLAVDAIRSVLESPGTPGVTALTIHGPYGCGLHVARLHLARAARLAGYVVIDSRFGALDEVLSPPRHLCVLDWMAPRPGSGQAPDGVLPAALTFAAAAGARRHIWIRFCRHPVSGCGAIALEPLMTQQMTAAIYSDPDAGPSAAEIKSAADEANGLPGSLVEMLSSAHNARRGVSWLHETAPEYVIEPRSTDRSIVVSTGGVARLERAVDAARAVLSRGRHARAARLLGRCATALAARGALTAAASASCELGELHLVRGQPALAAKAFEQARQWSIDPRNGTRALIGTGRVQLEQGRLQDAEASFRTALLATDRDDEGAAARRWLALDLCLAGRFDDAEAVAPRNSPLLSLIHRMKGDLGAAARAATQAIHDAREDDPSSVCEAHLAAAHVQAALGHVDEVRRHAQAAQAAARHARIPALRIRAAAETRACLDQCGVRSSPGARQRLLRATAKLPPLAAARVRAALHRPDEEDETLRRFVETSGAIALMPSPRDGSDLIHRFQTLIDAIHDTPDESAALAVIARDLMKTLDACSVVIRSARLGKQAASAGRAWPGEESLTQPVLDGGCSMFRDGVTPEAAEPVRVGGSVLGSIAVRWVTGTAPPLARAKEQLRVSAAAAAPLLRVLSAAPRVEADAHALYPDDLLGRGVAADRVRDAIRRAALAPYPVLIEGESGSGKELVARAIHARGPRRARRFCAVNCAALTDDLLEAELFGHARGAFTGAVAERPGLFEEADQGTIFLDEAGELTPRAQAKLLRVLQEGEVRRVGENMPRKVDARVVAATNRSLEEDARAGRFRADLRFRLDVIRIAIPPLRERPDEVPWLVQRLWAEAAARVGTRATLGDDVVAALARYDWPGNVRELQNVIASLAVHGPRRGRLPASLLPAHIAGAAAHTASGFDEAKLDFERRFIRAALARAGGRKTTAAAQLGVSRQGLTKIIKRLGIVESHTAR
jgi:DNA-binding NtrC family response regulator/tetratricopeptide (TPR) repeat protein